MTLSASPTLAQVTEFQGGGFLTGFSQQCATDGWSGTVQVTARMRGAGDPGNSPTESVLNLFMGNFAMHFRFVPAVINTASTATGMATIGGGFGTNSNPMPTLTRLASPENTVIVPANERHFVYQINNFSHVPNCSVRLNVWLHRR